MGKFYFFIWLYWALRTLLESIVTAAVLAGIVAAYAYVRKDTPQIVPDVIEALNVVWRFWFALFFNVAFLLTLFRSVRFLFYRCVNGYRFVLYTCDLRSTLKNVGYGDLLPVWRRWFLSLIWLSAAVSVVLLTVATLITREFEAGDYFSFYRLVAIVLLSGYFTLWLLPLRCKRVKVERC